MLYLFKCIIAQEGFTDLIIAQEGFTDLKRRFYPLRKGFREYIKDE